MVMTLDENEKITNQTEIGVDLHCIGSKVAETLGRQCAEYHEQSKVYNREYSSGRNIIVIKNDFQYFIHLTGRGLDQAFYLPAEAVRDIAENATGKNIKDKLKAYNPSASDCLRKGKLESIEFALILARARLSEVPQAKNIDNFLGN